MASYKIPYGFSNYKEIRAGKYLYVDKTKYIEELERMNSRYLVFLRPRRFGKSLFVSMLHYYYDRKSAGDFQRLFGDTYIGSHKTAPANTYYVLRFEFSGLDGRRACGGAGQTRGVPSDAGVSAAGRIRAG